MTFLHKCTFEEWQQIKANLGEPTTVFTWLTKSDFDFRHIKATDTSPAFLWADPDRFHNFPVTNTKDECLRSCHAVALTGKKRVHIDEIVVLEIDVNKAREKDLVLYFGDNNAYWLVKKGNLWKDGERIQIPDSCYRDVSSEQA